MVLACRVGEEASGHANVSSHDQQVGDLLEPDVGGAAVVVVVVEVVVVMSLGTGGGNIFAWGARVSSGGKGYKRVRACM